MEELKEIAKKLLMDAVKNNHLEGYELTEKDIKKAVDRHDFDVEDIFYNALVENILHKLNNEWHENGI